MATKRKAEGRRAATSGSSGSWRPVHGSRDHWIRRASSVELAEARDADGCIGCEVPGCSVLRASSDALGNVFVCGCKVRVRRRGCPVLGTRAKVVCRDHAECFCEWYGLHVPIGDELVWAGVRAPDGSCGDVGGC